MPSPSAPARAPVVAGPALIIPLRMPPTAPDGPETGRLTALRLTDGAELWSKELTAEQPLGSDDRQVYVASGDALHAVDATTGEIAWRLTIGSPLTAPPFAHAGWVLAAAAGELLAIRSSDGAVIWRQRLGTIEFRPSLDGDLLVVPIMEGRIVALDLQNGNERWTYVLGASPGEPFTIADRVYVGTQDKLFYSLYASSGREEWRWSVGAVPRGRAAVDDRHVYFVAMDHMMRALNRRTGNRKWMQGLPYRPAAGPLLFGTRVVVPGQVDGALPAWDASTGEAAGAIPFPAMLIQLPVLVHQPDGSPTIIGITGGLDNKVSVTMLEPPLIPAFAPQPLTALPGEAVPLPLPPVIR